MVFQPVYCSSSPGFGNAGGRLGWGDFRAIEESVGGIEEIRNLQDELIHLSRKVQAAQKGLHDYIGAITLGQEEESITSGA